MNLRRFMHRTRKDEDLAEEIESHLAHEQDANGARGLSAEEARRQARLKFGNPRTTREDVWRYRSLPWLENGWRDLRFGLAGVCVCAGRVGERGEQLGGGTDGGGGSLPEHGERERAAVFVGE